MNLKQFLKKYGTQTTSNFDLIKIAKDLNLKPFYVIMRDEIENLKTNLEDKLYVVTNLHTSDEPGIHWNCFVFDKTNGHYFFDSYGLPPVKEIQDLLKHATYSTFQIQKKGTSLCGQLCLFVLEQLQSNKDFTDIILDLKSQISIKKKEK